MFLAIIIGAAVNLGMPVFVAIILLALTSETCDEKFGLTSITLTALRLGFLLFLGHWLQLL